MKKTSLIILNLMLFILAGITLVLPLIYWWDNDTLITIQLFKRLWFCIPIMAVLLFLVVLIDEKINNSK